MSRGTDGAMSGPIREEILELAAVLEAVARQLRMIADPPAPEPPPAAAPSRAEVEASVQRSIAKLPVLGARHPDAAPVIERVIDNLTPDEAPPTKRHRGARKGASGPPDESGTSRKA